jgi:menaquinone-specific isochorismate synthase
VPSWQVSRAGGTTTAVANLTVHADSDLEALAGRVWRAHGKFSGFRSGAPAAADSAAAASPRFQIREISDYREAVRRALRQVGNAEFRKIVVARAIDLEASQPLHPLRVLNGLRQRFPECYAFSRANGRGQSFIGASPSGWCASAGACLKPRRWRDRSGGVPPRAKTPRSRRACSAARRTCASSGRSSTTSSRGSRRSGLKLEFSQTPQLRRLANVQHLHTAVRSELPENVRLLDVLAALHPTPAVGGSPRGPALARIRELETFSRGLYAGALGWLNARGGGEFFVGLRSALVDGCTARVYAGAGIVAGSAAEKEFAETELKFKAMLDALLTP